MRNLWTVLSSGTKRTVVKLDGIYNGGIKFNFANVIIVKCTNKIGATALLEHGL